MADLEDVTLDGRPLQSLRVADLKAALEERGLSKSGQKNALVKRLKGALMLENLQRTSTAHIGLQPNSHIGEEMSQNSFIKQYLAKQQELLRQRLEREAREAYDTNVLEAERKEKERIEREKALEQERLERERLERQRALEQERLERERAFEQERLEMERVLEQERLERAKALEQQRLEREKVLAKERLEREKALEQERIDRERALEQERLKQERALEQQRLELERKENERIEREKALAQERIEKEKALDREREEKERFKREAALEEQRKEKERLERESALQQEKLERERALEKERKEKERALEHERLEKEKAVQKEREEQERALEQEKERARMAERERESHLPPSKRGREIGLSALPTPPAFSVGPGRKSSTEAGEQDEDHASKSRGEAAESSALMSPTPPLPQSSFKKFRFLRDTPIQLQSSSPPMVIKRPRNFSDTPQPRVLPVSSLTDVGERREVELQSSTEQEDPQKGTKQEAVARAPGAVEAAPAKEPAVGTTLVQSPKKEKATSLVSEDKQKESTKKVEESSPANQLATAQRRGRDAKKEEKHARRRSSSNDSSSSESDSGSSSSGSSSSSSSSQEKTCPTTRGRRVSESKRNFSLIILELFHFLLRWHYHCSLHVHVWGCSKLSPGSAEGEQDCGAAAGRKRRWGSSTAVTAKKPSISITTDSLKSLIPDIGPCLGQEAAVDLHPEEAVLSGAEDEERERSDQDLQIRRTVTQVVHLESQENGQEERDVDCSSLFIPVTASDTLIRRSISQQKTGVSITIDDPVRATRQPSPPRGKVSSIVHISNLVRPFTLGQLKELLSRTGTLVEEGFWIDKIKSHCFVTYCSSEEAVATRASLHGVKWPQSNPKVLSVDFCQKDELDFHKGTADRPAAEEQGLGTNRGRTAGLPPLLPERDQWAEREREMERREKARAEREWDRDKVREFGKPGEEKEGGPRRSRSRERRRKERGKSKEKKTEKKEKMAEDPPAKLLDDLFRKTKAAPCIYWLPLTDEQFVQRESARADRMKEREKRRKEQDEEEEKKREEERKERMKAGGVPAGERSEGEKEKEKEKEKDRERDRDRGRDREKERERETDKRRDDYRRPEGRGAGGGRRSRSRSDPRERRR
uniref:SAP domain-containing protein n=1 Tax=Cyclopterus lumpus TaxID=8103 RepID=A0A8C2XEZ5_CYCLU